MYYLMGQIVKDGFFPGSYLDTVTARVLENAALEEGAASAFFTGEISQNGSILLVLYRFLHLLRPIDKK
jgi:hypothetical protein